MSAGYSGTPLAKKLGIKPGFKVRAINAPKDYQTFFDVWPEDVQLTSARNADIDVIHIFASTAETLEDFLKQATPCLKTDGALWISWPKKSSKIPSEIGKFDVMKAGQAAGLVDVKVAAIDDDWSGHKFVYRLQDRKR